MERSWCAVLLQEIQRISAQRFSAIVRQTIVCVFERETEGVSKRERERRGEREIKSEEEGGERGRNLLYHTCMSAIVVAAPLLLV